MQTDLIEKIRRFHDLHEEVKPAMKQLAALREYFLELSGGQDAVFNDSKNNIEIVITREQQTRVDLKKLRLEYADLLTKFEAVLNVNKVTCRKRA